MKNSHKSMPFNLKSLRTRFALNFLKALKNINHQEKIITHQKPNNIGFKVAQRYHKVKVAADASMAVAAGPRRAWTRAILLRIRPRSRRHVPARREILRRKQRRGEVAELRRLVPGGEDMDLQSLFDETAHYVKCLTTQGV